MTLAIASFAAFFATMCGGIFALRLKDKLHLALGFSAGAVLGVAFFDLIPEAFELASRTYSLGSISSIMAIGFVLYMIVSRIFAHKAEGNKEGSSMLGNFGAGTLAFHSFFDGMGIGLAFKVSTSLGLVVAVAVLAHDFSDGLNTVNFILKHEGSRSRAFNWLFIDAIAPILGVISASLFYLPKDILGLLLALFSGFFLYIGASDLVPESHHAHPVRWTTIMTVLGMLALYAIIQLVSHYGFGSI